MDFSAFRLVRVSVYVFRNCFYLNICMRQMHLFLR